MTRSVRWTFPRETPAGRRTSGERSAYGDAFGGGTASATRRWPAIAHTVRVSLSNRNPSILERLGGRSH